MDFIGVGGPSAKPRGHTTEFSKREGVNAEKDIDWSVMLTGSSQDRVFRIVFAHEASSLAARICS